METKKIYQLKKDTYFFVTLSVMDLFIVGEVITEYDGEYKYQSKVVPPEYLIDKPLVEMSHQIHARVASHAIGSKVSELVDKYL